MTRTILCSLCLSATMLAGPATAAPDLGRRACAQEARKLCPAEMRSLSRRKVEACMIAKVDQVSPVCHAAMLRIRDERAAAGQAKSGPSAP